MKSLGMQNRKTSQRPARRMRLASLRWSVLVSPHWHELGVEVSGLEIRMFGRQVLRIRAYLYGQGGVVGEVEDNSLAFVHPARKPFNYTVFNVRYRLAHRLV